MLFHGSNQSIRSVLDVRGVADEVGHGAWGSTVYKYPD